MAFDPNSTTGFGRPETERLHREPVAETGRTPRTEHLSYDLVVVGGGLAGTCCAITAAREGLTVALVQDRPVLGGNGSSEVRLWFLGATAHMHNNCRWAREGGLVDEIMTENVFRNREGEPLMVDPVLLEKVVEEPNVSLFLNTAVYAARKKDDQTVEAVDAFCSQTSIAYQFSAPLFVDASGDGILAFQAGLSFRMGAESPEEFGEPFAPDAEYGDLLGHSLYFYTKDMGRPVSFTAPSFAKKDVVKDIRIERFNTRLQGCSLWWIEYGGRLDTIHGTEAIKWELWKVVYGLWDHVKNSGEHPEAANLGLEWVGHIPGKRESRRFEGLSMLVQQDIVEQRACDDAIAFGGWAIDLHPADGVYSDQPACTQWHTKGVYPVPYRTIVPRDCDNLYLAGRIISASHVAFGSTRVMMTCAYIAQAAGVGAAICKEQGLKPADLVEPERMRELQTRLSRRGQHIPGYPLEDPDDLLTQAVITASSQLAWSGFPADAEPKEIHQGLGQMIPLDGRKRLPAFTLPVTAEAATDLTLELRVSSKTGNHTPDVMLASQTFSLKAGEQVIDVAFDDHDALPVIGWAFLIIPQADGVRIGSSYQRVSGLMNLRLHNVQAPEEDIGVESFEIWPGERRPKGRNLAVRFSEPVYTFGVDALQNGWSRPAGAPNAWVADPGDGQPTLTATWDQPVSVQSIHIDVDTDFDHPMESVLWGHPESVMPFCVRHWRLKNGDGSLLAKGRDNHQSMIRITLAEPVTTDRLVLEIDHPSDHVPAAVLAWRAYAP